ncbi:MAG TPA: prenyltransferase/squalene oxidase repeat-containing protein [Gemmataceae bacterium]
MPARKRIVLGLGFATVLMTALSGLFAPSSRGRAPAPERKKDKYDQAIERGLEWLALHQAKDGSWSLHEFPKHAREKPLPDGKTFICDCAAGTKFHSDIAATAFGVLPFLGAGYGTKPSGKEPDYSKTISAALKYLVGQQNKDGGFADNDMYAHGLATRTLCDAYALTKDKAWKEPAQKALDFIVEAQDPMGGGWRYRPRQPGDLSVTGWQFTALKRGQLAGLKVPKETLKLAENFLDSCENAEKGGYGYVPGHDGSIAMTAAGLLCRQYSGVEPDNPGLLKGVQKLKAAPPDKHPDVYYLYYATQVMHNMQGDSWRFWNTGVNERGIKVSKGMRDFLFSKQDSGDTAEHSHQKGSWSGSQGGRIMATSLLLCLEQRNHQPLYRRKIPEPEK